jgi:hypothetical protein
MLVRCTLDLCCSDYSVTILSQVLGAPNPTMCATTSADHCIMKVQCGSCSSSKKQHLYVSGLVTDPLHTELVRCAKLQLSRKLVKVV